MEAFYGEKLKLLILILGAGAVLTAAFWVNERSSMLMEEGHFLPRKEKRIPGKSGQYPIRNPEKTGKPLW